MVCLVVPGRASSSPESSARRGAPRVQAGRTAARGPTSVGGERRGGRGAPPARDPIDAAGTATTGVDLVRIGALQGRGRARKGRGCSPVSGVGAAVGIGAHAPVWWVS
ncbi:hypothetical protein GCM10027294_35820 [Marinactinospora endophytica]